MLWYVLFTFYLICLKALTFAQYSCYDNGNYLTCYYWLLNGACADRNHYDLMYQNCRQTCNLCPVVSVISSRSIQENKSNEEGCKDNRDKCPRWKRYCEEGNEYYEFMVKNCRRTCLFCADVNLG